MPDIITRPATPEYRTGWDRVFGPASTPSKLVPVRKQAERGKLPNTGLRADEFSEYTERAPQEVASQ